MGDARNCCASTDLSTIDYSAGLEKDNRAFAVGGFTVFVDINGGAKGSSTLWEDIFPFYVGTNGRVYPGYPLDAPKAKNAVSNDVYLAGNSVKIFQLMYIILKRQQAGVQENVLLPIQMFLMQEVSVMQNLSALIPHTVRILV